ncbi:ABC transporter ATP-binding protein [Micromonospora sp. NPDC048871]|uniref:ABC transporter ATP-binding protein n=1 Tax=unclassified Micromonospora TaxID=2617518 RepID=UPI00371B73D0
MSDSPTLSIDANALAVAIGRRTIVHHVDLHLEACGVLGLLGPNGAGKTTLMRSLSTAIAPSGGSLRLLGREVSARGTVLRSVRKELGYAPQHPLVLRHLSAVDQVAYAAWLKGIDGREGEHKARAALAMVDLSKKATVKTGQLSGGMLRRLGIAMALVHSPKILLLDEPTAGLDPEQRLRFHDLIRTIGREAAVVLSTHLVEDVATLCTSVAVIAGGRSIFSGSPADLAARAPGVGRDAAGIAAGFAAVTGMKV